MFVYSAMNQLLMYHELMIDIVGSMNNKVKKLNFDVSSIIPCDKLLI